MFHVQDTLWFHTLLTLLTFVLLVSVADRVADLAREQLVTHAEGFYEDNSVQLSSELPPSDAAGRIEQALVDLGMVVRQRHELGAIHVRAQLRSWANADTLLSYSGALLLAAALAVGNRWGWRQLGVRAYPNETVRLGPQAAHRLELVQASPDSRSAAIEVNGRERLLVSQDRGASNTAFRYELTEQGGPLVSVTAQGASGEPLTLSEYTLRPEHRTELRLAFSAARQEEQTVRLFILPEEKVVVRLEWLNPQQTGAEPPRFRQWVFEDGGQRLVGTGDVAAAAGTVTTQIGAVTYDWTVSSHAVFDVSYEPGRWLLGVAAVFALLGVAGQFIPREQAWGIVQADEDGATIRFRGQSARGSSSHAGLRRHLLLALGQEGEGCLW
jgi:hypothetical protein